MKRKALPLLSRQLSKQIFNLIRYTIAAQQGNATRWRSLWQGLQRSFRLMVGVADYEAYLNHMRSEHPELAPMDAKTFYRHCVAARYPSADRALKKCPC